MMPDIRPPPASSALGPLQAWATLIEAMLHAVWLVDAQALCIVGANRAAGALLGVPAAGLLGKPVLELAATPEELCFWGDVAEGATHSIQSDTLVRRFDGATVPVTRRVSRVELGQDAALYVVALHDRSEQVRAQSELEVAAAQLAATLESTADGILVTDLSGRIRNFNQRFAQLWGVPESLLLQRDDVALRDWMRRSVIDPAGYALRLAALEEATMLQSSDVLHLHSGKVVERVSLPQCSHDRPIGRVYSYRDITEKIEAGERIETLSYTDPLTGLPNRRRLADRIKAALTQTSRDLSQFALLFLNLDRFKYVNDTLGHAFGDRVLIDVAERLRGCLRSGDTVARLGSDEFVLMVNVAPLGATGGAEASAQRVMEALRRPFHQAGMNFTVTASIGITLAPNDGAGMDELMDHADAAMQEAKRAGGAGFRFHRAQARRRAEDSRSRMQLDHAMRLALARNQFRLHYQPQVDTASGSVHGAEALIRWTDPELGEVSPGEFIPVAEESGFIIAIGDWVLHQAVAQAAEWQTRGLDLVVSVNVSALQFQQPGFVEGVAQALRDAQLPAAKLELELTESMLVHDAADALLRLEALAQLGVKLAIDDFGTGYSSLSYLKRLPVHRLKIDRSFVDGLPDDESDAGIVQAIISMGRALRLQIVAEGVETEAQRRFLKKAGCEQFQGFLYARALDPRSFEARLAETAAQHKRLRRIGARRATPGTTAASPAVPMAPTRRH
jgi:diguanylate cyclase (GGDEF)-like protein/PAS domain S-box-containing protein